MGFKVVNFNTLLTITLNKIRQFIFYILPIRLDCKLYNKISFPIFREYYDYNFRCYYINKRYISLNPT